MSLTAVSVKRKLGMETVRAANGYFNTSRVVVQVKMKGKCNRHFFVTPWKAQSQIDYLGD